MESQNQIRTTQAINFPGWEQSGIFLQRTQKKSKKVLQLKKLYYICNRNQTATIMNNEKNTMRFILAVLVKECGQAEGQGIFEWYCQTYKVDITSEIPATVRREVLGC